MMSIMIDDVQLTSNVINAAAACAQAANKVALPFFDSTLAAEDLGGIPVASMEIRWGDFLWRHKKLVLMGFNGVSMGFS